MNGRVRLQVGQGRTGTGAAPRFRGHETGVAGAVGGGYPMKAEYHSQVRERVPMAPTLEPAVRFSADNAAVDSVHDSLQVSMKKTRS